MELNRHSAGSTSLDGGRWKGKGKSRNWHLTASLPAPKHRHNPPPVLSLWPPLLHRPAHCLPPCYRRRKRQGGAFWCGCTHWRILASCSVTLRWKRTSHDTPNTACQVVISGLPHEVTWKGKIDMLGPGLVAQPRCGLWKRAPGSWSQRCCCTEVDNRLNRAELPGHWQAGQTSDVLLYLLLSQNIMYYLNSLHHSMYTWMGLYWHDLNCDITGFFL